MGETINDLSTKYFTPDIQDIRVGYECERDTHSSLGWIKVMVADYHFKTKVPEGYTAIGIFNISEDLKQNNWIRVPYLTKEQIEAEGWEYKMVNSKGDRFGYQKNNYYMIWFPSKNEIEMIYRDPSIEDDYRTPEKFRFWCICKDINTFRYVNKLLGI